MATRAPAKKAIPAKAASSASVPAKRQKDACDLLDADHKAVKKLFKDYEALAGSRSRSSAKKRQLADSICRELMVHATLEEEIFYPAVRAAIKDDALLNEATVEHASAKELISQIQGMQPEDALFDAKVTVLGEYIDHHVKEERNEMFPKAKKSRLDLVKMRSQLETRKGELMSQVQASGSPQA